MIDLHQFTTSPEAIKPSDDSYDRPDDDTYEYEVTKVGIYEGATNKSIYIDYNLSNGMRFREWFALPAVYGQETPKEIQAIGRYLRRLVDLGVPKETVNTFSDTDSLIGWRGVFDLVTRPSRNGGRPFQNISKMRPSQGAPSRQGADAGFIAAPTTSTPPAVSQATTSAGDDDNPFS